MYITVAVLINTTGTVGLDSGSFTSQSGMLPVHTVVVLW